ncbi:unnamed protein product [Mycena citricolor]|uniref:Homeobox domain-containing protein n=1 Tax=Mycena citricolor TaxID=2018698 RepID=A0AAD2K7H2_9AGAR|nr:unnamed protein product [Mycena citricolor]
MPNPQSASLQNISRLARSIKDRYTPLNPPATVSTSKQQPDINLAPAPPIRAKLQPLCLDTRVLEDLCRIYDCQAEKLRSNTEATLQRTFHNLARLPVDTSLTPIQQTTEKLVKAFTRRYQTGLEGLEQRALAAAARSLPIASSSQWVPPPSSSPRHSSASSSRSTSSRSSSSSSGVRSRSGTPTSERAAFKTEYAPFLQRYFTYNAYPCGADRSAMAEKSGMTASQINVWFQNHRARLRRDAKARGEAAPVLRRVETWERAPLELCLQGMGSVAAARPTMRQVVDDSSEGWDGRSDGDIEDPEPVREEVMAEKRTRNVLDAVDPPPHAFPARNTLASPAAIRATTAFAFECPWPRAAAPSAPSPPRRAPLSMGELAGRFAGLTTRDVMKTPGDGYADGVTRFRNATYCVQPVSRALRTPWELSCPSSLPLPTPVAGRPRLRVSAAFARQAPASFPRPASPVESFSEMESEAESGGPSTPVDAFPVLDLAGVVVAGDDDPLECLFDETAGAW